MGGYTSLSYPAGTLGRRGDLVSTGRQPISLAPLHSGLTSEKSGAMEGNRERKSGGSQDAMAWSTTIIETAGHLLFPSWRSLGEYVQQRVFREQHS